MDFILNGRPAVCPDEHADDPLLATLRDTFALVGPRLGCGAGLCGACTVHVDGRAVRSCVLPTAAVADREVTTLEGLAEDDPVVDAWRELRVPQCGYCQNGQLMTVAALRAEGALADPARVDAALSAVLCRCGTQPRIARAIARLRSESSGRAPEETERRT